MRNRGVLLPDALKVCSATQAIRKFALAADRGLVMIGTHHGAPADVVHVQQLQMTSPYQIFSWARDQPISSDPGSVVRLDVTSTEVRVVGGLEAGELDDTVPGDLFITEERAFIVGKRASDGGPRLVNLESHQTHHSHNVRGLIAKTWALTGRNEDKVVFEVDFGTP